MRTTIYIFGGLILLGGILSIIESTTNDTSNHISAQYRAEQQKIADVAYSNRQEQIQHIQDHCQEYGPMDAKYLERKNLTRAELQQIRINQYERITRIYLNDGDSQETAFNSIGDTGLTEECRQFISDVVY